MSQYVLYAANLIAITVLVFGFFLRRHRRPELIVAYLTTNIGVLAVTTALGTSTIGAGLGLGLFGILSIIRLRSEELTQTEVAYYFAALTLGLLGGLGATSTYVVLALMACVLLAIAIGDHPRIAVRTEQQSMLLERAIIDQAEIENHLETLLKAPISSVKVIKTDIVNDTTLVDVRYRAVRQTDPRGGRKLTRDAAKA